MGYPLDMSRSRRQAELIKEALSVKDVGKTVLKKVTRAGLGTLNSAGKGAKGMLGDTDELMKRLKNPIEGIQKGWAQSANTYGHQQSLKSSAEKIRELASARKAARAAGDADAVKNLSDQLTREGASYKKMIVSQRHLRAPSTTLAEAAKTPGLMNKSKAIADELSRRGWTGSGGDGWTSLWGASKYLPVGQKSMGVGFTGLAIPDVVNAAQATPTGEGGAVERGMGLGMGTAGMLLGTGLGLAPAIGLAMGGDYLGSRLGRIVDRARSGANLRTAISAPSPTEAAEQLENINRYYG